MTDDTRADEYRPEADVMIDMRDEYADQIEDRGIKSVSGVDWPLKRIHLDDTGSLTVHFDASNSSDADALTGNGIESYEWTVLFDSHTMRITTSWKDTRSSLHPQAMELGHIPSVTKL